MGLDQVQAIFFDFDGVILDSTHIKTNTFRDLYTPYGEDVVNKVLQHHLHYGGISRVVKIKTYHSEYLNQHLSDEELEQLCLEFSNAVKDAVVRADWIPGAEDFIIKYADAIDLYIVSGTPEDELSEIVEKRGLKRYFKEIMGSPTKKPDHVRRHLKQSKLDPKRCFFIGDALTDMNTALETDLKFIGIQGAVTFPDGIKVLPDCTGLVSAMEELLNST